MTDRALVALSDEELVKAAPDLQLTMAEGRRIARLAMMIQRSSRVHAVGPTWEELPPERQQAAAMGALRVVQALVALGYVEGQPR